MAVSKKASTTTKKTTTSKSSKATVTKKNKDTEKNKKDNTKTTADKTKETTKKTTTTSKTASKKVETKARTTKKTTSKNTSETSTKKTSKSSKENSTKKQVRNVYKPKNVFVKKGDKIKYILISQPAPESEKSPYFDLAKKYNLNLEFKQFICVEGIGASEFRKQKINILDYTSVIFTSKNAVDHFFRICQEMRISMPDTTKYFCLTETIAFYLQKYMIYRKRKIFYGKKDIADLIGVMKKHKTEKFLLPCSDVNKKEIIKPLDDARINYTKAIIYRTVSNDMSDIGKIEKYDMLVFFSHAGIVSLFKNFPNFKQGKIKIACVGSTTLKAAQEHGLKVDVTAPTPQYPSITAALDAYLKLQPKK